MRKRGCYVYGLAYTRIMVSDNEDARNKHLSNLRWRNWWSIKCCIFTIVCFIGCVTANRPPQFLTGAQTEIVLRLKEGPDSPVGEYVQIFSTHYIRIVSEMALIDSLLLWSIIGKRKSNSANSETH